MRGSRAEVPPTPVRSKEESARPAGSPSARWRQPSPASPRNGLSSPPSHALSLAGTSWEAWSKCRCSRGFQGTASRPLVTRSLYSEGFGVHFHSYHIGLHFTLVPTPNLLLTLLSEKNSLSPAPPWNVSRRFLKEQDSILLELVALPGPRHSGSVCQRCLCPVSRGREVFPQNASLTAELHSGLRRLTQSWSHGSPSMH